MSGQRTGGLELLRQRVTCPICKEFYTTPKRLSCSHVFCLNCIKRHLQVHRTVNFPPCPMCRRPINKAYSDVISLEPARAEEDIIEFVKQFEICGICQQKENPRVKCTDCEFLLCDDCRIAHDMMQPIHTVVNISSLHEIQQNSTLTCLHHGKPVNRFCIMCERAMCVLCEWFEHDVCTHKWDEQDVRNKYRQGFLSHFIQLTKWSKTQVALPRVVSLQDLLILGRNWNVDDSERLIQKRRNQYGRISKVASSIKSNKPSPETLRQRECGFDDVLRLQDLFRFERHLESKETLISSNKGAIGIILGMIGVLSFNLALSIVGMFLPASVTTTLCISSTVYLWIIIGRWSVFIINQIGYYFQDSIQSTFLNRQIRRALVSMCVTILKTLLCASMLHYEGFIADISFMGMLIPALWAQFFAYCFSLIQNCLVKISKPILIKIKIFVQKKLKAHFREYRFVQSIRSYLGCPKFAILIIIVAMLFRAMCDFLYDIWWCLI